MNRFTFVTLNLVGVALASAGVYMAYNAKEISRASRAERASWPEPPLVYRSGLKRGAPRDGRDGRAQ